MTILTSNFTYSSIPLTTGALRIDNIFGGVNGWNSYVLVFPTVTDAKVGTNQLGEFNAPFAYVAGQDPLAGCEAELNSKFSTTLTVAP